MSCVAHFGDKEGGCVGRRQATVHKWREQSKINILTCGMRNPVKQRSPNNLLNVSYRPVQMSISLRAGCLAEPLSANVVSSLQDGDLRGADKGSARGGAQKRIREVVTSEKLPTTWVHLTCPESHHLGQQHALLCPCRPTLSFASSCLVHRRCVLSQHMSQHRLSCPEEAGRESRSKQAMYPRVLCLPFFCGPPWSLINREHCC